MSQWTLTDEIARIPWDDTDIHHHLYHSIELILHQIGDRFGYETSVTATKAVEQMTLDVFA